MYSTVSKSSEHQVFEFSGFIITFKKKLKQHDTHCLSRESKLNISSPWCILPLIGKLNGGPGFSSTSPHKTNNIEHSSKYFLTSNFIHFDENKELR